MTERNFGHPHISGKFWTPTATPDSTRIAGTRDFRGERAARIGATANREWERVLNAR